MTKNKPKEFEVTKKKSHSKKSSSKKKTKKYIAKAPVRKIMTEEGAKTVAPEAVDKLIDIIEKNAAEITKEALKICKAHNRTKITAKDIKAAIAKRRKNK